MITAFTLYVTVLTRTLVGRGAETIDTGLGALGLANTFDFNVATVAGAVVRRNTVTMGTAGTLRNTDSLVNGRIAFEAGTSVRGNTVGIYTVANRFTSRTVLGSIAI